MELCLVIVIPWRDFGRGPLRPNGAHVSPYHMTMDRKDLRTLKLLEEIEQAEIPSQRDLAKALGISLGLVNSFVRRMASKGYVKITSIPKSRVRYDLTPEGAVEKTRLTYEFIQYSSAFYRSAREKLRSLFQGLAQQGIRRIAFYGAGDLAEIAYISLQETPINVVAVVDDLKSGQSFLGITITGTSDLSSLPFDKILITVDGATDHAVKEIMDRHVPSNKVVMLA